MREATMAKACCETIQKALRFKLLNLFSSVPMVAPLSMGIRTVTTVVTVGSTVSTAILHFSLSYQLFCNESTTAMKAEGLHNYKKNFKKKQENFGFGL